jgi:hypothetical protein
VSTYVNNIPPLTDDELNSFVYDLTFFIEKNYNNKNMINFFHDDENYEALSSFIFSKLDKFSNGYINYN